MLEKKCEKEKEKRKCVSLELQQVKGKFEGLFESNERRLQKSESEKSVLFYLQDRIEESVSNISQKVETLSSSVVAVSGKVKVISEKIRKIVKDKEDRPVAYICSDSLKLSLREINISIFSGKIFSFVKEGEAPKQLPPSNVFFAFESPEIPVVRIVNPLQRPGESGGNPPRPPLSQASGQNAPGARNAESNPPQHPLSEEEANDANRQNESEEKGFLSLFADFFCSIAEVLAFLFSFGKYRKSFRGKETRSGMEKFKKLGKKIFKIGKFFSLKCTSNFVLAFLNIQMISSPSESEMSSPARIE